MKHSISPYARPNMSQIPPPINETEEPWQVIAVSKIMNNPQASNYRLDEESGDVSWDEPHAVYGSQTKTWRNVACSTGPLPPPTIIEMN